MDDIKRLTIELTPKDQEYITAIKASSGERTTIGVIRRALRNLGHKVGFYLPADLSPTPECSEDEAMA